ncbi:MAG: hypothetical protein OEN01_03390 [Candidatus Krumholzibacteria bacterium]|nr:hypothetical protein [Candidatus Krumholzibacteria bacterium]
MHTTSGKNLFYGRYLGDWLRDLTAQVKSVVDQIPSDQLLNTSDDTLVEHVVGKLSIEPLTIYRDQLQMENEET